MRHGPSTKMSALLKREEMCLIGLELNVRRPERLSPDMPLPELKACPRSDSNAHDFPLGEGGPSLGPLGQIGQAS